MKQNCANGRKSPSIFQTEITAPPAGTGDEEPTSSALHSSWEILSWSHRHHLDLLRHRRLRLHWQSHQDAGIVKNCKFISATPPCSTTRWKSSLQTTLLKEIKQQIGGEKRSLTPSSRLNKLMDRLDQRNNVFMYVIPECSSSGSCVKCTRETWKEQYASELPGWLMPSDKWMRSTHWMLCVPKDSSSGKGNSPIIIGNSETTLMPPSSFRLRAKTLWEIRWWTETAVSPMTSTWKNDLFHHRHRRQHGGESTYLRTVGINYLLGLHRRPRLRPELWNCMPVRLIQSAYLGFRTTTNPYFFAELKRLKLIIDKLQAGGKFFIILDRNSEVPTPWISRKAPLPLSSNSWLCRQMASLPPTTYCWEHSSTFSDDIPNYRFESDIQTMNWPSYRLAPRYRQNMNACFLMKNGDCRCRLIPPQLKSSPNSLTDYAFYISPGEVDMATASLPYYSSVRSYRSIRVRHKLDTTVQPQIYCLDRNHDIQTHISTAFLLFQSRHSAVHSQSYL